MSKYKHIIYVILFLFYFVFNVFSQKKAWYHLGSQHSPARYCLSNPRPSWQFSENAAIFDSEELSLARRMYEKMQAIGVIAKSRRLARVLKNPLPGVFNSAERVKSSPLEELATENVCEFSSVGRRFHSAASFLGTLVTVWFYSDSSPWKWRTTMIVNNKNHVISLKWRIWRYGVWWMKAYLLNLVQLRDNFLFSSDSSVLVRLSLSPSRVKYRANAFNWIFDLFVISMHLM